MLLQFPGVGATTEADKRSQPLKHDERQKTRVNHVHEDRPGEEGVA